MNIDVVCADVCQSKGMRAVRRAAASGWLVAALLAFSACSDDADKAEHGAGAGAGRDADGAAGQGPASGRAAIDRSGAGASGAIASGSGGAAGRAAQAGSAAGAGGLGGCGVCPAVACPPTVLSVMVQAGSGMLGELSVEVEPATFTVSCRAAGSGATCAWHCQADQLRIADGDYTVTFTAPGYEPFALELQVANPTSCGCCGCCPWAYWPAGPLVMQPSGEPTSDCCDTGSDPRHCGACGNACAAGEACIGGNCRAAQWRCDNISVVQGSVNCNYQCGRTGETCVAQCGGQQLAYAVWSGSATGCADLSAATVGTSCSDPIADSSSGTVVAQCCCVAR